MKKFILAPLLVLLTTINSAQARIDPYAVPTPPHYADAIKCIESGEYYVIAAFNWLEATIEEMRGTVIAFHHIQSLPPYPNQQNDLAELLQRVAVLKLQVQALFEESIILTLCGNAYFNRLMDYVCLRTHVFPTP